MALKLAGGAPTTPLAPFGDGNLVTLTHPLPFPTTSATVGGGSFESVNSAGGGSEGGTQDAPFAAFAPLIAFDPVEMSPVPEPGTWLLMGTGLAAAWRAHRHK